MVTVQGTAKRVLLIDGDTTARGNLSHSLRAVGFATLEISRRHQLGRALDRLWTEHNEATDGTTRVQSEYLEAIAVLR